MQKNFCAASDRVIGTVSAFGEELLAHLVGGTVVSQEEEFVNLADVYISRQKLAVQVKMCNGRHAHRPTVGQIANLHKETEGTGFLVQVSMGVYALVFYMGIHTSVKHGKRGKSKLLSRKIGRTERRVILANELQYVYILDVRLMQHLATSMEFRHLRRRSSEVIVCDRFKSNRERQTLILCLNRNFLKGFIKNRLRQDCQQALDQAFGTGRWSVAEDMTQLRFSADDGGEFGKTIPIRVIGGKKTVSTVRHLLSRKLGEPMHLGGDSASLIAG